jgi:hypothetical protein
MRRLSASLSASDSHRWRYKGDILVVVVVSEQRKEAWPAWEMDKYLLFFSPRWVELRSPTESTE